MKSTLQILLLCVLFIGLPLINADSFDDEPTISTDGYGVPNPNADGDNYGPGGDEMGDEEAALQAQRLMLFGCYFFTKNMLFHNVDQFNNIVDNHVNKDVVDKKIISDFMYDCVAKASPHDLQELVTTYGEGKFDPTRWDHLHSFSAEKYQDMKDLDKLTETDLVPFKYFLEIDQTVRQHMEQLQEQYSGAEQPDVKIWGVSLNEVAYYMKFVFAASFIGLLATAIYNKFAAKKEVVQNIEKLVKDAKTKDGKKTEKTAEKDEKKTEKKTEKKAEKTEEVKEKDAKEKKDE